MNICRVSLAAAAFALGMAPAQGQERAEILFNMVDLQAQAEREVANDTLTALLAAEAEGPDPAALADTVNRAMRAALDLARGYPAVAARSMNYQTFPVHDRTKIVRWRVRQQLRLESRDFAQATVLIGKLQGGAQTALLVTGMSTGVSPETRRQAENELIAEAIAAFHERAAVIRIAQKAASYRVKELHIETGATQPRAFEMARMASSEAAAPAVEPGTTQVRVSVRGSIQLQ